MSWQAILSAENSESRTGGRSSASNHAGELTALTQTIYLLAAPPKSPTLALGSKIIVATALIRVNPELQKPVP